MEATDILVSVVLWVVLSLYVAGNLYWVYQVIARVVSYNPPPLEHGGDAVEVRIVTIGNEAVVAETVRNLPTELDRRYVISEEPIDVPGAEVLVVPDEFESEAVNKGRAIEWARQAVPCQREYVLYLDEDSHMTEFDGLPDSDIVQFTEQPRRTTSLLTHLCEINRMGFQIEQRGFQSISIPLYTWGGGVAIRRSIEEQVTWEYPTLIEDTVFTWRAFVNLPEQPSFSVLPEKISGQSPPSLSAMIRQRRRWISGSREDNTLLSLDRVIMYGLRDLSWSVTGVVPLFVILGNLPGVDVFAWQIHRAVSLVLLSFVFLWVAVGVRQVRPTARVAVLSLVLAPMTSVLHSVGALWGLVSPPDSFDVTEKADETSDQEATQRSQPLSTDD
ncbi:glycosyltransferase family 2 protein (plasmid) [Salinirubellus salinus]|uniref:Glycosyltransferase family 2 protein n=1 Tax=Salinirubellus salinus TaxID=1364945 RepID=A0A9E7R9J7_9EURY|nr:glycosyltransferase family 2 protein [Salinirubellus salinus]UWM56978.1 glycosyltransferase family 2 protein [Salinirubellus salinus]